jgi:hypothetical protein
MHPVKSADGYHGIFKQRQLIDTVMYTHKFAAKIIVDAAMNASHLRLGFQEKWPRNIEMPRCNIENQPCTDTLEMNLFGIVHLHILNYPFSIIH